VTALDLFSVGALDLDDVGPSAEWYRELHDDWITHANGGEDMSVKNDHDPYCDDAGCTTCFPQAAEPFATEWTGPAWRVPQEAVAPVETGAPWRGSAEREWDDSR
jgi:hypothetical protein